MVLQPRSGRLYLTGAALWTHSPMHVLFFDRPLGYIIPLKRPDLVLILTTISSLLHSTRTSDATSGAPARTTTRQVTGHWPGYCYSDWVVD
ncbi:hypothetical protein MTP99_000746 [Tenebrio molitor]|nr:hypothetical protein MTP99_000746 [Tenebrio molitor]